MTPRDRIAAQVEALQALVALAPDINGHAEGMLAGLKLALADTSSARSDPAPAASVTTKPEANHKPASAGLSSGVRDALARMAASRDAHAEAAAAPVVLQAAVTTEEAPSAPEAAPEAPGDKKPHWRTLLTPEEREARRTAKPHWTALETPEARKERMKKAHDARRNASAARRGDAPPAAPAPEPAAPPSNEGEKINTAPPVAPETAMAAAIAKAADKNEQAKALIRRGEDAWEVSQRTGLPMREVYRLKGVVREEDRKP